jgi:NADPH:quinone reductase-like Zn-dependent oxidoreductase
MLALVSEPTPAAGRNEVLIEVEAVGVSFVDGLIVEGKYQVRPELPFTPSSVFPGQVLDRGPDVEAPSIGAREIRPPAPRSVPRAAAGALLKRFGERGVAGKFVLDAR